MPAYSVSSATIGSRRFTSCSTGTLIAGGGNPCSISNRDRCGHMMRGTIPASRMPEQLSSSGIWPPASGILCERKATPEYFRQHMTCKRITFAHLALSKCQIPHASNFRRWLALRSKPDKGRTCPIVSKSIHAKKRAQTGIYIEQRCTYALIAVAPRLPRQFQSIWGDPSSFQGTQLSNEHGFHSLLAHASGELLVPRIIRIMDSTHS
jgi:hypothetical protein